MKKNRQYKPDNVHFLTRRESRNDRLPTEKAAASIGIFTIAH